MGYYRPYANYNVGKKAEFDERKYFSEKKAVEHFADVSKTQAAE